jgi:hypothetical protein
MIRELLVRLLGGVVPKKPSAKIVRRSRSVKPAMVETGIGEASTSYERADCPSSVPYVTFTKD